MDQDNKSTLVQVTNCCWLIDLIGIMASGDEWLVITLDDQSFPIMGHADTVQIKLVKIYIHGQDGHYFFINFLIWKLSYFDSNFTGIYSQGYNYRQRKNFWAFTRPKTDLGPILIISNMVIHKSFTGPTHLLSANVRGPVSWCLQLTISQHWFRYWLDNEQATSHCLNHGLIYWYRALGWHFLLKVRGSHHLNFQGHQAKFEGSLHWIYYQFSNLGGSIGQNFTRDPFHFQGPGAITTHTHPLTPHTPTPHTLIVNWTLQIKLQRNCYQKKQIFLEENETGKCCPQIVSRFLHASECV